MTATLVSRSLVWLGAPLTLICGMAQAELKIVVNCDPSPMGVAVADLTSESLDLHLLGADLAIRVAQDLEASGIFKPVPKEAFIQASEQSAIQPAFDDWRVLNAEVLVTGKVQRQNEGSLLVDVRIWDVLGEREMTSVAISSAPQNRAEIAHRIADAAYRHIVGTAMPHHRLDQCCELARKNACAQ